MSGAMDEYFEALQRLIDNKPINVPKGSKINNDTVALEAGRKRGSIKKGREMFAELIEAINSANETISAPVAKLEGHVEKYKSKAKEYRRLYEESLNRELMLIEQLNELQKQVDAIKNGAVNNV